MATYDLLATYPENVPCENCSRIIGQTFYITISGRVVCSKKCAQNLPSTPEDSCYICGKPVFEEEYYATKTKYFCSEKCKDIYQKDPNKKYNSSVKNSMPFERAKISEVKYSQNKNSNYSKKFTDSKKLENFNEPRNLFNEFNSSSSKKDQKLRNSNKSFNKDSAKAICKNCGKKIIGSEVVIFSSTGEYCSHECLAKAGGK